jgi:cytochrome c oxidase subunit 2
VPGRVNRLVITATRPGTYRGQCAEFCGEQHARMALHVVAMPPAEFDAWLAARAAPRPDAAAVSAGRQAFAEHGCAACHAVEATRTEPSRGPNLAHVSSRSHLGAGVLPNDAGAYKRWLVGVQQLKPGALMPSYAQLDAATLDALAAYLESLR